MTISITNIISFIITFQSILFALVLFTHSGQKKISNALLASFLLVLASQFSLFLIEELDLTSININSYLCVFGFAYGPLLFLYSNSLIFDYFKFKPKYLYHFIPSLIIFISPFFGYPLCLKIGLLLYLSLGVYVILAIKGLMEYRKIVLQTQSSFSRKNLKWLQWTMIIFSIAIFLDVINQFIIPLYFAFEISITHLTILFLVIWMFYKGLKQPQLFLGISEKDESITKDSIKKVKEQNEEVKTELDHIKKYFEENKPYTNSEISLHNLAVELQIPERRLSYLINTYFNKNFMSFINFYRIEYAKECFINSKDPKETIIEVMYDVGFNSKSSFNTIFKQSTGFTPSEFKKKHSSL
jgi:AraC-like DNA-binding protein